MRGKAPATILQQLMVDLAYMREKSAK